MPAKGLRCPMEERFWKKVFPEPMSGCWLWAGSGSRYGSIGTGGRGGKKLQAHRWAYERYRGPIPDGLELDHLCRNTWCVNPQHLEPVTHVENSHRGARFSRQGLCAQGHAFDVIRRHGRVYTTCENQRIARYRAKNPEHVRALANRCAARYRQRLRQQKECAT